MKNLFIILITALSFASATHATDLEAPTERLEIVYEVSNFIVNYSPSSKNLGRVIAARCPECAPEIMTFDQDTLLIIGEQLHSINEIGKKAEWSGLITVTNQSPNHIIKFTIY